ncbi:MAG: O-antigen ligase family protein [Hyphomicrobium aestuarii]|nr:O-antigen ligase family protein [Hyphomicrobium aestuarii]
MRTDDIRFGRLVRDAGLPGHLNAPTRVPARPQIGLMHALILAAVWLTFASSGIVFSEPAPVDILTMGLIVLLPAAGLLRPTPRLVVFLALWGLVAAGGFLASTQSDDLKTSTRFTVVSVYLYIAAFMTAAFIAHAPQRHVNLILSAWLAAAIATSLAGLAGYFDLVPGAYDLFTRFGRASGTFKDPNVMGAFLVAPFLYALHLVLHAPAKRGVVLTVAVMFSAGLLALATLLTMSRGAWLNLAVGLAIYTALAYATATSTVERSRITLAASAGVAVLGLVTLAVMQDDRIGQALIDRATVTQSYDVGPAGRFGGQQKALDLLLTNPVGIGAGQFVMNHHYEDVHNVYLSVFLNNGWLGGLAYAVIVLLTIGLGLISLNRPSNERGLMLVALAAFAATAFEGIVIDTDHWRSFYLLCAIVWGLAAAGHPSRGHLSRGPHAHGPPSRGPQSRGPQSPTTISRRRAA